MPVLSLIALLEALPISVPPILLVRWEGATNSAFRVHPLDSGRATLVTESAACP